MILASGIGEIGARRAFEAMCYFDSLMRPRWLEMLHRNCWQSSPPAQNPRPASRFGDADVSLDRLCGHSSEFMNDRISLLMEMRESDPTEAIGKSKELIESCCKTILGKMQISADKNWDLNNLVKETMKALSITTEIVTGNNREAGIVKQILGSLSGLATGVAEFRNEYGCGHGREAGFLALPVRHAKLAVGSSITLVEYLWETYNWRSGGNQN